MSEADDTLALAGPKTTLRELNEVLSADVRRHLRTAQELSEHPRPDSPEWQDELGFFGRAYIRAFFAHVEGTTYAMREAVLARYREAGLALELGELALLSEKRFEWKESGLRSSDNWNTLPTNLRLAFHFYPRLFGREVRLDFGTTGAQDFEKARKIRDRLMHPKSGKDLQLSLEDVQIGIRASLWYLPALAEALGIALIDGR